MDHPSAFESSSVGGFEFPVVKNAAVRVDRVWFSLKDIVRKNLLHSAFVSTHCVCCVVGRGEWIPAAGSTT